MLDYERRGTFRHATMANCIDAQKRSHVWHEASVFEPNKVRSIEYQREAAIEHELARVRLERLIGIN